jgi:hypothetical protein
MGDILCCYSTNRSYFLSYLDKFQKLIRSAGSVLLQIRATRFRMFLSKRSYYCYHISSKSFVLFPFDSGAGSLGNSSGYIIPKKTETRNEQISEDASIYSCGALFCPVINYQSKMMMHLACIKIFTYVFKHYGQRLNFKIGIIIQ